MLYYLPYHHLIAIWRHLFTILPSLSPFYCCLETLIYYFPCFKLFGIMILSVKEEWQKACQDRALNNFIDW